MSAAREEGLAAIEEAVGIYRSLAEANAAGYLLDLASSLNNLSVRLAEASRRAEAVAMGDEADHAYTECRRQGWVPDQA